MFRYALVMLVYSLPAQAQDAEAGKALFREHCATCHGAEARGDGPQSASLNPQPKDLTLLQADGEGIFPLHRVLRRIDGRETLVAHGSPMPVFAGFFAGPDAMLKDEDGAPVMAPKPIADIVTWLKSVQR